MAEFRSLLEKWVAFSSASKMTNSEEYAVGIKLVSAESPNNKA